MRKTTLEMVNDGESISCSGNYVVISGKHPWIFHRDGTFIAKIKTIVRAYNMVFLAQNTMLMSSLAQRKLYYVSLENGKILWSIPHKKRSMLSPDSLIASPDGETVYYVYQANHLLHIDKIIPQQQICNTFQIPSIQGAVVHCFCDTPEKVSLLYTRKYDPGTTNNSDRYFRQNGILEWSPEICTPQTKHQWLQEIQSAAPPVACNNEFVLCSDFSVISLTAEKQFNLLENETDTLSSLSPFIISNYDSHQKLLTLTFLSGRSSIIIDCCRRKIAAHYSTITPGFSKGCLVDNEYWIGTSTGVIKRPFPFKDPYPSRF